MRPTTNEHHLLLVLKDEEILERTPKKQNKRKVVEKVSISESKSSSKFDDVFYVDYFTPSRYIRSLKGRSVPMLWDNHNFGSNDRTAEESQKKNG